MDVRLYRLFISLCVACFWSLVGGVAAADGKKALKKVDIVTRPTFKVGGRIFVDHLMIDQSPLNTATFLERDNRTRFDTARIFVEGDVYENVAYKIELAFGEKGPLTDRPTAKDVFLEVKETAFFGAVRVGHFKEPFSLEELTSSRFITFMERSLLNTFAPARNMGLLSTRHLLDDETLSWYAGGFHSEVVDDAVDESEDSNDYSLTNRIAWNPFYDEPSEGRYLTHLGLAHSYREFGDDNFQFRRDPGLNIAALNVIEVNPNIDNLHLFGAEAAWVNGPLYVQGEWVHAALAGSGAAPDGDFDAVYVQVGYFLTGEHKGYRKSSHAFDRTGVLEPFFSIHTRDGVCRGKGAWELKARWSYIDLTDAGIVGGRVGDWSTGVNWYLNSYTRMMFDYIHSISYGAPATDLPGGSANLFGMRAAIDF